MDITLFFFVVVDALVSWWVVTSGNSGGIVRCPLSGATLAIVQLFPVGKEFNVTFRHIFIGAG